MITIDLSTIDSRAAANNIDVFTQFRNDLNECANVQELVQFIPEGSGNTLELHIPQNYAYFNVPIRVPRQIDGNGWIIKVKNDCDLTYPWLFFIRKTNSNKMFHITPDQMDSGDYSLCQPELLQGKKLIIAKDLKEWTYRNDSNDEAPKYRSDAILLVDGKPMNRPIQPYNTPETILACDVYYLDDMPINIKNLTFVRDVDSTKSLGFVTIKGYDNINIENITVRFSDGSNAINWQDDETPIVHDNVFNIYECSNVNLSNVSVYGTYSSTSQYGYAYSFHTITNLFMNDVLSYGIWGGMGTFCMNNIFICGGDLNRFDVHYYGKNARIQNILFRNTVYAEKNYNRVGNFYGELIFDNCTFSNFIPMQFDESFHVYTGFDMILNGCTLSNGSTIIINAGKIEPTSTLRRKSLSKMCWPNLHINNLKLGTSINNPLYLFHLRVNSNIDVPISYISHVSLNFDTNTIFSLGKLFCNYQLTAEQPIISKCGTNDVTLEYIPNCI